MRQVIFFSLPFFLEGDIRSFKIRNLDIRKLLINSLLTEGILLSDIKLNNFYFSIKDKYTVLKELE